MKTKSEIKMRRKNQKLPILFIGVFMSSSILTYYTLYKKNDLKTSEVDTSSNEVSDSTNSKFMIDLQKKIYNMTSTNNTLKKPQSEKKTATKVTPMKKVYSMKKVNPFDISTLNREVTLEQPWCLSVVLEPKFTICVYMPDEDFQVSKAVIEKGLFRPHLTSILQTVFKVFPGIVLIDIGANLGYFSLMASSLGHRTIAVEAVASNVYRIHSAVMRSNLSLELYHYAIGEDFSQTSYLFQGDLSTGNRGHGKVLDDGESPEYFEHMYEPVQTITITQLVQNTIKNNEEIVLKLDINTEECKIFIGNDKVFSYFKIRVIVMKWAYLIFDATKPRNKNFQVSKTSGCNFEEIEDMVNFLLEFSGYRPFDVETRQPLYISDLLGTDKSSWLSLQNDHHVIWLHHSISEVEKSKILQMTLQNSQDTLQHFYDLAVRYQISPVELRGNELKIKDKTYKVFDDNTVKSSPEERPLSEAILQAMADNANLEKYFR